MSLPARLADVLEVVNSSIDRAERIDFLISLAQRFPSLPKRPLPTPYDEAHRVPGCESEAFVWAFGDPRAVSLEYRIENPQGLSAMALAVLLKESLEGLSAEEIARVPDDLPLALFGAELSMGKAMGLTGIVRMTKHWAAHPEPAPAE